MKRASARVAGAKLALVAFLFSGIAHAADEPAASYAATTSAARSALGLVWQELQVDGTETNFNAFIQGHATPSTDAAQANGSATARPAPSLLWVLGASIIGLATVARRRSL